MIVHLTTDNTTKILVLLKFLFWIRIACSSGRSDKGGEDEDKAYKKSYPFSSIRRHTWCHIHSCTVSPYPQEIHFPIQVRPHPSIQRYKSQYARSLNRTESTKEWV
mmetsp:Transcript_5626/g.8661  ORF Transcript_5626/g.8661 Transcript_5626/m.8661 type:complete len:106 (-) Transcript_5626:240-557(-)